MWYVNRRWDWIWSWKPISLWLPWHHPDVSLLLSTFFPPPSSSHPSKPSFLYIARFSSFQPRAALPSWSSWVLISYRSIWWFPEVYSQLRLNIQSSASHLNASLELPTRTPKPNLTMLCLHSCPFSVNCHIPTCWIVNETPGHHDLTPRMQLVVSGLPCVPASIPKVPQSALHTKATAML